jgi:hypothetical protein
MHITILSVIASLVSAEEFAIFTSALEAGALYTGNSLGQILEYILTGRDTLSQINDFDLFTWLSEEELKKFEYIDYRGDSQYQIPDKYSVHMGVPEYAGKVSLVKIHSWAGNGTGAKGYFTNNPMGNWVDCWVTKDEVYLGASFIKFTQDKTLVLNQRNPYLNEALSKFEKKLNQGQYTCKWFIYELGYNTPDNIVDSCFYKEVKRIGSYTKVKYFSNLSPEILLLIGNSWGYLTGRSTYDGPSRWEELFDLLTHYVELGEDQHHYHEWCNCLEKLSPLSFRGLNYKQIAYFYFMYAKAVTIQPVDKKWKAESYPYQQMFKLLIAQGYTKLKYALAIKPDEWKSGKVHKGTMMYLGVLKGSPKMSKVLLALGLSEKEVSIVLGAGKVATSSKNKATTIRGDKQSFLEQGNSVYYSSCQATDPRASWSSGQHLNQIEGDLPFIGDTLFLWTIGSLMSEDGKGFVCRAKLRVIFKPTNEILGLYIDRVYGNEGLLRDYTFELEEWWTNHSLNQYGVYTPVFESSYNDDYVEFKSPSSASGYQDNLSLFNRRKIKEVSAPQKSLLYQAYCSRDKAEGCYTKPLTEVRYNPQNGKFS